jgi:hypothetical protein
MVESLNHKSINTDHAEYHRTLRGDIRDALRSDALKRLATLTAIAGVAISGIAGIKAMNERPISQETSASTPAETADSISEQTILTEINNGPEGDFSTYEIPQDQATGIALEAFASKYAKAHNTELAKGQDLATFMSAKEINEQVKASTGGSVQPDTEIDTWADPETGLILSALHESDSDK